MVAMQVEYLNAQDRSASYAQLTQLYSVYLAEALAINANLSSLIESKLLHLNSSSSLLPVSWNVGEQINSPTILIPSLHIMALDVTCLASLRATGPFKFAY